MNQRLTQKEIDKIKELCFTDVLKACAIAQIILDTCQIVSCKTFAFAKKKSVRTIQYQSNKLNGITIENRKYLTINQTT